MYILYLYVRVYMYMHVQCTMYIFGSCMMNMIIHHSIVLEHSIYMYVVVYPLGFGSSPY